MPPAPVSSFAASSIDNAAGSIGADLDDFRVEAFVLVRFGVAFLDVEAFFFDAVDEARRAGVDFVRFTFFAGEVLRAVAFFFEARFLVVAFFLDVFFLAVIRTMPPA